MREIKFRAKAGTQWRYGDLYHNERGELVIYEPKTSGRTLDGGTVDGWRIKVDPETVGQFTGLYDANGREIYEGDIVRVMDEYDLETEASIGVVKYYAETDDYPAFDIEFLKTNQDGRYLDSNALSYFIAYGRIVVIGNVHDNPELLEKRP